MLFNSFEFLFLFLPLAIAGYYGLGRLAGHRWALAWLVAASLAFYAYWDPRYLLLLVGSAMGNFGLGLLLAKRPRRWLLTLGVAANLGLLGYYKYAHFFLDGLNALAGAHYTLAAIVLPLGISFFTFTQIAYLVDVHRGLAREADALSYLLFVTFFPHLIAGPILHHADMMSQFARADIVRPRAESLAVGWSVFAMGLVKKVLVADPLAAYVNPVFAAAGQGHAVTLFDGWLAALGYTLQLYFDFSGYSDMAVGLACLFNIRLPVNFFSPYRAASISEFWRRWHMTLSSYLRDYLYIPLGGNRRGNRYLNLFVTMLLGGLWHGAAWTYVFWGGLHGAYLVVNHLWRAARWPMVASRLVTFLAVVVAWVFFRARSFGEAGDVLAGMAGLHGVLWPTPLARFGPAGTLLANPASLRDMALLYAGAFATAWWAPNTLEWVARYRPALGLDEAERLPGFRAVPPMVPSGAWALALAAGAALAVGQLDHVSEFLYFQF